jgi:hypothetical protein
VIVRFVRAVVPPPLHAATVFAAQRRAADLGHAPAPCEAVVQLRVSAGEARKRKLGRRAVTLASEGATLPEAGNYAATLSAAKRYRAKLRRVRQLRTTLLFACVVGDEVQTASRTVTFRR